MPFHTHKKVDPCDLDVELRSKFKTGTEITGRHAYPLSVHSMAAHLMVSSVRILHREERFTRTGLRERVATFGPTSAGETREPLHRKL
ncbi:hypothetical protein DPMN_082423 [Dreissena polymorpha]|uniref:Uncharacterized protein n=1 Tax=Dreissena polymorpha TaxID=45954 RepID=A0A9D3YA11_DREPO|nr:hypothetical protein DPMN_082423 [Dreissena polymorpha]